MAAGLLPHLKFLRYVFIFGLNYFEREAFKVLDISLASSIYAL